MSSPEEIMVGKSRSIITMTPHRIAAATMDLVNAGRQITIALSFPGQLDYHALKNALRALLEVEPILGCRLVGAGREAFWERRGDVNSLELLTVEQGPAPVDTENRFAARTYRGDPLVQALLLRNEDGDALSIRVSHAVTDAAGAQELLPVLSELYTRYREEPDFWPDQGEYNDRGFWQIIDSAGLLETLAAIPAASPPGPVFWGPAGGTPGSDRLSGRDSVMRVIGPERFRIIREAADSRGATMIDVLLTAFFRALCRTLHPSEEVPLPLEVSVDMRYLLPEEDNRRIANLSGAVFPALAWIPGEQFRTTLTRAKEQMDGFTAGFPGLASILHTLVATESALKQPEDAFIPRLEYWDFTGKDGLVFGDIPVSAAHLICPAMPGEGPVLCASTFRDTLTLTAGFQGSRKLMDTLLHELDTFP